MKTNKALLSAKNMLGSRENFDPLPDIPIDYETKELSAEEHSVMMSYKCNPRSRNFSPEDQYYNPHWVQPDLNLTVEIPMMVQGNQHLLENKWRERFHPEDHEDPGNSRVHKVISLRIKEAKHQRKSTIPGGYLLRFTYEQRVMIVCRRLAKTGDPILGRPDRLVFEDFKERFWYTSIYHKERKASAEKGFKHMKAWFFFHVYETLEALKERAKTSTRHLNNETIIDMCLSSDDDDQIDGDTPLFKIVEKSTVTTKEVPTQSTEPISTSTFKSIREDDRGDSTSLSHLISSLTTPIGS